MCFDKPHIEMQSSHTSSFATSNCSLQSISCNNSMGGSPMTHHSMQEISPANNYGQLDCSNNSLINTQQYTNIAEAQGDENLCKQASSLSINGNSKSSNKMFEANPNPKTNFRTSPIPNPNPNCMEYPVCVPKEGQGEWNGDHASSVNGSHTLWDNSEGTITVSSWRRPSPTAASCFCKDIEKEQEYFQQQPGASSHGWTDEKHSSYLDSMETDFLKSVMFKGSVHSEPSDLDDSASSHQAKAAKEFKVCQNGRWRPVCMQAAYVDISPLKQFALAVKNPWIKRFRASKRAYFPSLIMEDTLLEDANTRFDTPQRE